MINTMYLIGRIWLVVSQASMAAADFSSFTPLFLSFGTLVALIAFLWNAIYTNSADYLKESERFYEKAFSVLQFGADEHGAEKNSSRWISAARLLIIAQATGNKAMLRAHKNLHRDLQHFWRIRFRDLVVPSVGKPPSFRETFSGADYAQTILSGGEVLDKRSVAVIIRFIEWPDRQADSLENIKRLSNKELEGVRKISPKLFEYLKKAGCLSKGK